MKTLKVKLIDSPVTISQESIEAALDAAQVGYCSIDSAAWPERNNGYSPEVKFRMARSKQALIIEYAVREEDLLAEYGEDNECKPFKDSCCEFFFSPTCDDCYYNLELNCIGKGTFAYRRGGRKGPKIAYGEEIMSKIARFSTLGDQAFGLRQSNGGAPFEWRLCVLIPFECFTETPLELGGGSENGAGVSMRANFYKCGDSMPKPHFLTWNRIEGEKPDFHRPDCFGELLF